MKSITSCWTFVWVCLLILMPNRSIAFDTFANQSAPSNRSSSSSSTQTHFILSARYLRPGHAFKVLAIIFQSRLLTPHIECSIYRDTVSIVTVLQPVSIAIPHEITLHLPNWLPYDAEYRLQVRGNWALQSYQSSVVIDSFQLTLIPKPINLILNTDRPLYRPGDTVLIRLTAINSNLAPYDGPLQARVLDSAGCEIQHWPILQAERGIAQLSLALSSRLHLGEWRAEASADFDQSIVNRTAQFRLKASRPKRTSMNWQSVSFLVIHHEPADFEVHVSMANVVTPGNPVVSGWLSANYSNGSPVHGNATVYASVRLPAGSDATPAGHPSNLHQSFHNFNGLVRFEFSIQELAALAGPEVALNGGQLVVSAWVGENRFDSYRSGFAQARLLPAQPSYRLVIVGGSHRTFKPLQPIQVHVLLVSIDGWPIPYDRLSDKQLTVHTLLYFPGNRQVLPVRRLPMVDGRLSGIWRLRLDLAGSIRGDDLSRVERVELHFTYAGHVRSLIGSFWMEDADVWLESTLQSTVLKPLATNQSQSFQRLAYDNPPQHQNSRSVRSNLQHEAISSDQVMAPSNVMPPIEVTDWSATNRNLTAILTLSPFHSPNSRFISLYSSTEQAKVNENVIMHVHSNFHVDLLHYVIMSRHLLISHGRIEMRSRIRTFHVTALPDMAPECTLLVFAFTSSEFVSDSITIPVWPFVDLHADDALHMRFSFGQTLPEPQAKLSMDHSDSHDLKLLLHTGNHSAQMALGAMRNELFPLLDCQNHLDSQTVWMKLLDDSLHSSSKLPSHTDTFEHIERVELFDCANADSSNFDTRIALFPSVTHAKDTWSSLNQIAVHVATDALLHKQISTQSPCGSKTCTTLGSTKVSGDKLLQSSPTHSVDAVQMRLQRLQRNLLHSDFGPSWLWTSLFTDGRRPSVSIQLPASELFGSTESASGAQHQLPLLLQSEQRQFTVNAFALESNGITLLQKQLTLQQQPVFQLTIDFPSSCYRHEIISIRATVRNYLYQSLDVLLTLDQSNAFRFVPLQSQATVQLLRLLQINSGTGSTFLHQLFARLKPFESRSFQLPIEALHIGRQSIVVRANVWNKIQVHSAAIHVRNRSLQTRYRKSLAITLHDSSRVLQLDWSKQSHVQELMDVKSIAAPSIRFKLVASRSPLDQLPFQAPKLHELLQRLPSFTFEQTALELFLHSVRLQQNHHQHRSHHYHNYHHHRSNKHDQIRPPSSRKSMYVRTVNLLIQSVLAFQNGDGGFRRFAQSKDRSRLASTVLAIHVLSRANVLSEHVHVDRSSLRKAIQFLLRHQINGGAFDEPNKIGNGLNESAPSLFRNRLQNTAHVLLALTHCNESLHHEMTFVHEQIARSIRFLESSLERFAQAKQLESALPLVTWCLIRMRSPSATYATKLLVSEQRRIGQYVHYGPEVSGDRSDVNMVGGHVQLEGYHVPDSISVQQAVWATAFGLLVHIEQDLLPIDLLGDWLNAHRSLDHGWPGGPDANYWCLIAMESWANYPTKRESSKPIKLLIEDEPNDRHERFILNRSSSATEIVLQRKHDRAIRLIMSGSGFVQLYMEAQVVIPSDSLSSSKQSNNAFDWYVPNRFKIQSRFQVTFKSAAWVDINVLVFNLCVTANQSDDTFTGQLEVQLPTGYRYVSNEIDKIRSEIELGTSILADIHVKPQTIVFYVEKKSKVCIPFTAQLRHPVANSFGFAVLRVIEHDNPQNALVQHNLLPILTSIQMCDVCASYECDRCPDAGFASFAIWITPNQLLTISTLVIWFIL